MYIYIQIFVLRIYIHTYIIYTHVYLSCKKRCNKHVATKLSTHGWLAVFRSQDSQGDRHVLAASDLWSCGIVIYVRKTQRLGGIYK